MRAYVESNFVLELVLEQEQHQACEEIVRLAETGTIELVIPALGLIEPFMTLHRRRRELDEVARTVKKHLRQIARTASLTAAAASSDVEELFGTSNRKARQRYDEIRLRLARTAAVLPLTDGSLRAAEKLRAQYGFELPDATIFAAILHDLRRGGSSSCFLNRNTHDFREAALVTLLAQHACTLLGSFDAGLAFMRSRIASE